MQEINKRIRELRLSLGLNQEKMGCILHLSKSGVCDIENGRRKVTESHIVMLKNYAGKNINEDWLRYGTGEMFRPLDALLSELSFGDDEFIKDFIEVYLSLDQNCRDALKKIMYKMAEKYSGKGQG